MRRSLLIAAAVLVAVLALPASASAHALLTGSEPARGTTVETPPTEVVLRFSEPVEAAFGALRVVDKDGQRVDDGKSTHPDGRKDELRVGVRRGIADGTYVATYRVISADSHPVRGGVVFSVGRPGAAPADVTELLDTEAGPVTKTSMKIARGFAYLATAVLVGALIFLGLVWMRIAPPAAATDALAVRLRTILGIAAFVGFVATDAGLVLQAAQAEGTTAWAALDSDTLRELLRTNFGQAWGARLVAFAVLGILVLFARRSRSVAVLAALAGAVLVATPALAGHARATDPVALNVAIDAVHVLAMSAWMGGLALILFGVPAATRVLNAPERTRLLAGVLRRFSPIALGSVAVLIVTGTIASVEHLTAFSELWTSPWGRLILAKVALVGVLVGLGGLNQRRSMPKLDRLAAAGDAPGDAGRVLRNTLRAEVALGVVVLAVTGVLVGISPPASQAGGPQSFEQALGPVQLQATVDPATAGVNELHLYLLRKDGQPFTGAKEVTLSAELPSEDIGPLPEKPRRAGPGHYVVESLPLTPSGDWELHLAVRVSEFDQYEATLEVPIR